MRYSQGALRLTQLMRMDMIGQSVYNGNILASLPIPSEAAINFSVLNRI